MPIEVEQIPSLTRSWPSESLFRPRQKLSTLSLSSDHCCSVAIKPVREWPGTIPPVQHWRCSHGAERQVVELLWDQLLQFIEEESVVAVVGPELVQLSIEGRQVPLYSHLAERLAPKLGVSAEGLPDANPLHEVACRHLQQGGDLQYVYSSLSSILKSCDGLQLPEPLLKLADIRPIQLYVSTTFDPFLARALDQVRFGGQSTTAVYSYSPDDAQDIPGPVETSGRPAVYHLFGKVSAYPRYAVTEEDVLEFVHSPPVGEHAAAACSSTSSTSGSSSWSAAASPTGWRASSSAWRGASGCGTARGKTDVVADAGRATIPASWASSSTSAPAPRSSRGAAASSSSTSSTALERAPPAGRGPAAAARPARRRARRWRMVPGAVFLSYASEDRGPWRSPARRSSKPPASTSGSTATSPRKGDDYEAKIKRNIERCSLFVPHPVAPRR